METKYAYIVEKEFGYNGCNCLVLMRNDGFRFGFVGVTEGHPFYGKNHKEIAMISQGTNGGLNFSTDVNKKKFPSSIRPDLWYFGWSYDKSWDRVDWDTAVKYFYNNNYFMWLYKSKFDNYGMQMVTIDDVIDDCKIVADYFSTIHEDTPKERKVIIG